MARAAGPRPQQQGRQRSEIEMHYGEAVLWIDALEWFIREHNLEVPTWRDIKQAGWHPKQPVDL